MTDTLDHDVEEELRARFSAMSRDELLEHVKAMRAVEQRLMVAGPQTDDELHAFIKYELKVDVPRVAVCEGHDAPFDFIADVVFRRVLRAIAMANRGGMKTLGMAIAGYVQERFTAGLEACHVGAVEMQAKRAYNHFSRFVDLPTTKGLIDPRKHTMQETRWENRSKVEILPGTINAVNGPHPQFTHADEVELMDPTVYNESLNMPKSGFTEDGVTIPAQYVITSTRKRAHGLMQKLWQECIDAEKSGFRAPFRRYCWCMFEVAQQVPNCRQAPENVGKPDEHLCECHLIRNGSYEDGSDRTLETVCRGKLHRSRGFMPYGDVVQDFLTIPRRTYDAQVLCIKPSTEGLVLPQMTMEAFGIHYLFDPANGPLIQVWDPGGVNPHAVGWYQELRDEVSAKDQAGREKLLPKGAVVLVDEFYKSGIGNTKCADRVVSRELAYREKHPDFRVALRIADPHNSARLDWIEHDPPLKCTFLGTHDVKEQIKCVESDFVDQGLFFVDVDRCPSFWEEVSQWHYPDSKTNLVDDPEIPVDDGDHMMSTMRYGLQAWKVIRQRRRKRQGNRVPQADDTTYERRRAELGPQVGTAPGLDPRRTEAWRGDFGPPRGVMA